MARLGRTQGALLSESSPARLEKEESKRISLDLSSKLPIVVGWVMHRGCWSTWGVKRSLNVSSSGCSIAYSSSSINSSINSSTVQICSSAALRSLASLLRRLSSLPSSAKYSKGFQSLEDRVILRKKNLRTNQRTENYLTEKSIGFPATTPIWQTEFVA